MDKILDEIKTTPGIPNNLIFAPINERRQLVRIGGFKNNRFDSVCIFMAGPPTKRHARVMLAMANRYVTDPTLGYLGVKVFSDGKHIAKELISLNRIKV